MCGICGIYGLSDKELLKRMTNIMVHRGPDDQGFFLDKDIMLGQRRLSIIDLKTGKQPIYNENQDIVVVFNGEIYNYIELKNKLEKKGHSFSTESDTEVIVHAYEEYGEKCLSLFNGMFAIALWDMKTKTFLLARDRVGIKPIYYTTIDTKIIFGSEIKSILEYPEVKRKVDKEAFHDFINIRYNPGEKTMFKGIYKLLPGNYIICNKKGIQKKIFWDLKINIQDKGEEYFLKELDKRLEQSVKIQLRSDVPVGLLLSSGLDSSTLAAYASKFTDKLKTFTMGFGENTDECDAAEKIAEHFGFEHKNLIIKNDLLKDFPKLIWHMDQPKRNLYPYYIYQKLQKQVKVVLSGLGGDELLGGYTFRYKYMLNAQKFRKTFPQNSIIKRILKKPVKFLMSSYIKLNSEKGNIIKDAYLDKLGLLQNVYTDSGTYYKVTTADSGFDQNQFRHFIYGEDMNNIVGTHKRHFDKFFSNKELSLINRTYLAEFKEKLPNDFLCVDDSMSMANSVESRVPFLDNKLIDLCFSIPNKYKFNGKIGKLLLRKNIKNLMPKKLLHDGKKGFSSNTHKIYKNELRDIAKEKLVNGHAVKINLINKEFIKKIISTKTNMDKTRYYNFIWNLYAFDLWYEMYIEK